MEMNKVVAAIFAASAYRSGDGRTESFLLHYDEMLEELEARDEAKRIAVADIIPPVAKSI